MKLLEITFIREMFVLRMFKVDKIICDKTQESEIFKTLIPYDRDNPMFSITTQIKDEKSTLIYWGHDMIILWWMHIKLYQFCFKIILQLILRTDDIEILETPFPWWYIEIINLDFTDP